jgi:hypothetical protein
MAMLALPIVGVALTFAAYAAMWTLGRAGRPAEGAPADLGFAGCADAAPVVAARLRDMGLAPETRTDDGGFTVSVVLPADPRVAAQIPSTLAQPGRLEVIGRGAVLATSADVTDASVRMDLLMIPSTLLAMTEAATARVATEVRADPDGTLVFRVDGRDEGIQPNGAVEGAELELSPPERDGQARWDAVAKWSVVLDHPLPCPIKAR